MSSAVLVRIMGVSGSAPREMGAEMLVWDNGIRGSIGGGRLEYDAISQARRILSGERASEARVALGPEIGQCCGGTVTLSFERVTPRSPTSSPTVLVFGMGHIGCILADLLRPLKFDLRAYDTRPDMPGETTAIPEAMVRHAPPGSAFVIVTHDHALDFLLVEEALRRGDARYVGMVGSKTKKAVLARRLVEAGLDPEKLVCPIGAAGIGDKRPEAIAVHTAAEIVSTLGPSC